MGLCGSLRTVLGLVAASLRERGSIAGIRGIEAPAVMRPRELSLRYYKVLGVNNAHSHLHWLWTLRCIAQ